MCLCVGIDMRYVFARYIEPSYHRKFDFFDPNSTFHRPDWSNRSLGTWVEPPNDWIGPKMIPVDQKSIETIFLMFRGNNFIFFKPIHGYSLGIMVFSYDQNGPIWIRSGPRIHSGRSWAKMIKISVGEKIRFIFYNHVSVPGVSPRGFFRAFGMTKSLSD